MLLFPLSLALLCPLSPDIWRLLELELLEAGSPDGKKCEVGVGIVNFLLLLCVILFD
jgi:hypothetical protein